jgi:hypothetical protein
MNPYRIIWLAFTVVALISSPVSAQVVIAPPFAGNYSFTDLGAATGVVTPYGGLTLKAGDPNTLLLGGAANGSTGAIYQIGLTRGAGNHITGFTGAATLYSTAPNIDGGLAYGPGGVLFYTTFSNNLLGQIKPGSSAPDKLIDLTAAGVNGSTGSVNFVPAGFPGAGGIRILSYSGGGFYSAALTPDGSGTYDLSAVTLLTNTGSGPEGLIHVPPASPVFVGPSMLIAEYGANRISAYNLDASGVPIPATRQDFMTGLAGAEGAFLDPLSGDFLFSTFGGTNHVLVVQGFASVPEPSSMILSGLGAVVVLRTVRRRRGDGS